MRRIRQNRGFTLIELILVVVLIGALSLLSMALIVEPFRAFEDVSRRSRLVDTAQGALSLMTRETRLALPNSLRITTGGSRTALEFLRTSTGGRYRARPDGTGAGNVLDFTADAGTFDVLGGLALSAGIDTAGGPGEAACLNGALDCLVIYNTGGIGLNAYNADNLAAITAASPTNLSFDNADGVPAFPAASPTQRFFVVDMPVSYVCDAATGELRRYADYGIRAVQPVNDADFGVAGALIADQIANCAGAVFTYDNGAGTRHGLAGFRLSVSEAGETVSLLQQAHVLNAP